MVLDVPIKINNDSPLVSQGGKAKIVFNKWRSYPLHKFWSLACNLKKP